MDAFRMMREAADNGMKYLVMEVSSHALVQRRAGAIDFALGVFTNLTQDHLDYHGTMEAYCDAKAILFQNCDVGVCNADDPWTERLLQNAACRSTSMQSTPRQTCGRSISPLRRTTSPSMR